MSASPLFFRGGRVFDGDELRGEVAVRCDANGRVAAVGAELEPEAGDTVVELEGKWLMPGLVDCHVHFREPGLVRKEGYATGSAGALHGGVTSILEIQNNPPLMASRAVLDQKLDGLRGVSRVDYGGYANLVEEALPELAAMRERTPAVKCFLGCSTGAPGVEDEATVVRWFAAAAEAGVRIVAHCEDNEVMEAARAAATPEELERHDLMRPVEAELASIDMAIRIAKDVGADLHVFHISSAAGARRVAEAARAGQKVTSSTAPHYLLATADDAIAAVENRFKVNPSIKYAEDRAGLLELLARGEIACVGTDHAPHPLDEKARPYAKAPSGFPSVDLLLPLMIATHDRHGLALECVLRSVTAAAADEFGLERKGRLRPGADADLVIFDPESRRAVDESTLLSKSKWSPYHGWQLRGFPERVWLRGIEVFRHGELLGEPRGEPLF